MGFGAFGQSFPSATTNTSIYTVPAGKSFLCTRFSACNQSGSTASNIRLAIVKSGDSISATGKQYIIYDLSVDFNDTYSESLSGVALSTGDQVYVYTANATVSFNLFGQEIDNQ